MSQTFAALQRLLPQHGLSRLIGHFAATQSPWIRRSFIHGFARAYPVDMTEAGRESLDDYHSFNDFFSRELKPGARPLPADPLLAVSPADGTISQAGVIEDGSLLQAKGNSYALTSLVDGAADEFYGGTFATVYLAPHNYHRVHLPVAGTLTTSRAIPGALFSVNAKTEASVNDLFARNERLVCRFETAHGPMLVILVGALIVASIETAWPGPASPYQKPETQIHELALARGSEIGRFLLGSTVIVCFAPGKAILADGVTAGQSIRMGQPLARLTA